MKQLRVYGYLYLRWHEKIPVNFEVDPLNQGLLGLIATHTSKPTESYAHPAPSRKARMYILLCFWLCEDEDCD